MRPKFPLNAHISPLEEILKLAASQGWILVTYDKDAMPRCDERLPTRGERVPGMAYVKARSIPQGDARGLAKAIQKLGALAEGGGDPLGVYFLT